MTATLLGRIDWDLNVDDQTGHRDYHLRTLVETTSVDDGPQVAGQAPGIPDWGAYWTFGNENDPWAFCHPQASVTAYDSSWKHWVVDQLFSTRPIWRCQDFQPSNPVFEPPRISGSFVNGGKAYTNYNANGDPVTNSTGLEWASPFGPLGAFPTLTGATIQTVIVEMNSLFMSLPALNAAVTCINDSPMWGMPAHSVLLANASFNRVLFGVCNLYYIIRLEFYVNYYGWDFGGIVDQGFYHLKGTKLTDNTTREGRVYSTPQLLDGSGHLLNPGDDPFVFDPIQIQRAFNFYSLGVPAYI